MAGSAFLEAAQCLSFFYYQDISSQDRERWLTIAQDLGRHCLTSRQSANDIANTLDHAGTPLRLAFIQGVQGLIDRETEFNEQIRELRLFVARETFSGPKLVVDNV